MTQPRMRPFRSARMAPHSCASSAAMPSAVSRKAPDSGSSLPRYCPTAAAMVAAMAAASAAVAARRTRVSLMVAFSRRLCLIGEEKPMGYQTIEVRKLTPVIGAEIFGVDLARPLGNQVFQEIHDALMDNLVIFFRDQELSHDQHKAFGRRFGDLHIHPTSIRTESEHPEILVIKADEHSKFVAGEEWHSDVSCDPELPMGSILYIKQQPPHRGGKS